MRRRRSWTPASICETAAVRGAAGHRRIGDALGLRHEDVAIAERQIDVMPRINDNRARAKGGRLQTIPASTELMRLYADYLTGEYGALDSDYVFVNLWSDLEAVELGVTAGAVGRALPGAGA